MIETFKKMNKKAINNGDVPVSCIITKNNKIISKAYNKKNINNNPFDHAEIIAIQKAAKKLKTFNLIDCELFVTLFPCNMCQEVIKESKIKKVHYILDKNKNVNNQIDFIKMEDENDYFNNELINFFKDKR